MYGGKIYWSDGKYDKGSPKHVSRIRRANLDGSNIETLYYWQDWIYDLVLDVDMGAKYTGWPTIGSIGTRVIKRTNLDGSNIETLVISDKHMENGLRRSRRLHIYWTYQRWHPAR